MTGWQDVLEEVVRTRRSALVGYACLFTADPTDAEDLVHEALARTFARHRNLPDTRSAEAYVRQAIRTTFLDTTRKQRSWRTHAHLFVATSTAPGPALATEAMIDVRAALAMLSPRERACVALRYFDDLTVADIARDLSLSTGAVKRYLSDGTAKLRTRLGPDVVTVERPGATHAPITHVTGRTDA